MRDTLILLEAFFTWGFLAYFLVLTAGMLLLNLVAGWTIRTHMAHHPAQGSPKKGAYSGFYPPISILVPAHNEEATIVTTIQSMMQIRRGSGTVGWVAFPFMLVFELLEPVVEAAGLVFFLVLLALGRISWPEALLFLALVQVLGLLQTLNAILLEELSYRHFSSVRQILTLVGAALLESFGYRQLNTWWRLKGLFQWIFQRRHDWGQMTRSGSWSRGPARPGDPAK